MSGMVEEEDAVPEVQNMERVGHVLDGLVKSRSTDGVYIAKVTLEASFLCTCPGSTMRDAKCAHIKALLDALPAPQIRQFILDAQVIPQ